MSYRIPCLASEQEAAVMVAADSFDAVTEGLQRMVCAGPQCLDCETPLGEPTAHDGRRGCPECGTYFALPNGVTWATFNQECGATKDGDDDCG